MYGRIKKIISISFTALILTLCFTSCTESVKTLTEKNNDDSLDLKINDKIEIFLESNPTTGYSWILSNTVDNTIISVTGPEYVQPKKDKDMVGEGGYEIYTIEAISHGYTIVTLDYMRSWEEEEPLETFQISISVD